MKVVIQYDYSGPKYHRLLMPCFLMPGIELQVVQIITDELCEWADIIYFNRALSGMNTTIKSFNKLKEHYKFKLVVDFDDHWKLEPDHILYNDYKRGGISEIMEGFIQVSDMVTVTHERLAQDVAPINSNVHVLPNAIPKYGQFMTAKQPSELTRLFWAGGITHVNDVALLRYAVRGLKDLPIQMVMGGYKKNRPYHEMRNNYTNYGKLPHELLESLPVETYYHAYSKCDIALIPLVDNKFNSHKSNLKILEAANIGANVIVSNVHPYKDIPLVNYVNEPEDWDKWVRWILNNPAEAQEQALNLQQYVDERFNFERINQTRFGLLKQVMQLRPQEEDPKLKELLNTIEDVVRDKRYGTDVLGD